MGRKKGSIVRYEEEAGYLDSEELVTAMEERMESMGLTPVQQKILLGKKKEKDALYNNEIKNNLQEQLQKEIKIDGMNGSVIDFMNAKMIEKAMEGNIRAYEAIVNVTGEKKEVVEHRVTRVQEIADTVIDVEEY